MAKRSAKPYDVDCKIPKLPPPESQNLASWLAAFDNQIPELLPRDILIGHSSGCLLALRLLERQTVHISGCFLICPFVSDLHNDFDVYNRSFYTDSFAWPRIKDSSSTWRIFAGDDDPYVPVQNVNEVANALYISAEFIRSGGHLNSESGYYSFPMLLQAVRQEVVSNGKY